MTNKKKLQQLLIKYKTIEDMMAELKGELTNITETLPDNDIEDDVEFFTKLKYNEIDPADTETWEKIQYIPMPVLIRWEQRLWLDRKSRAYGSLEEAELKNKLSDKGYKSVEYWLYYIPDYIKSIICDPSNTSKYLLPIITQYNKGNTLSKNHITGYFKILIEEILIYENKLNKS